MPAFLGNHLGERSHDVEMKPIHLVIETLCVPGSLGFENLHRVLDVPFLLCSNRGKGLAETARSGLSDASIACDSERFEHHLLNDQTGHEVALRNQAHECFTNPLPVPGVDVVGDIHSDLAAFSSDRGRVSLFSAGVLPGMGNFLGVVANGRKCVVVHGSHELAGYCLGQNVLPDRSGGHGGIAYNRYLAIQRNEGFHRSSLGLNEADNNEKHAWSLRLNLAAMRIRPARDTAAYGRLWQGMPR